MTCKNKTFIINKVYHTIIEETISTNTYTIAQWILFFMIYCLIGWIYESTLVSIKSRKLTNRGYLNGPFLPIYGSGAIIMLFATLPVRKNIILIFLFGSLAATILEYITGWGMEKIFHVRYWDYSNEFLNLNGHICLLCSVIWGVASVLLVEWIHKPVEKLIFKIDANMLNVAAIIFSIYFAVDFILSTRDAMDIRKFVDEYIKQNESVKRLQKRVDVWIAFSEDSKERLEAKIKESIADSKKELTEDIDKLREELTQAKQRLAEKTTAYTKRMKRMIKHNPQMTVRHMLEKPTKLRDYIKQHLEVHKNHD